MTLKEGNRIIALYIGHSSPGKYHLLWEYLMPIVEKIIQHEYEDGQNACLRTFGMIDNQTGKYMVRFNRCALFKHSNLKTATWFAVVDFAKHYVEFK